MDLHRPPTRAGSCRRFVQPHLLQDAVPGHFEKMTICFSWERLAAAGTRGWVPGSRRWVLGMRGGAAGSRRWVPGSRGWDPGPRGSAPAVEPVGPGIEKVGPTAERVGPAVERVGPSGRAGGPRGREGRPRGRAGRPHGREGGSHGREGGSHGREGRPRGREGRPWGREGRLRGRECEPHGREGGSHDREVGPQDREGEPYGREGGSHGREVGSQGRDGRPQGRAGGPWGGHLDAAKTPASTPDMGNFLDAALNGGGKYAGKAYFFKDGQYYQYDWGNDKGDSGYPKSTADWGFPSPFDAGIDAAIEGREGYATKAFFFKDDNFLQYDWGNDKIDSGYPKSIDDWGSRRPSSPGRRSPPRSTASARTRGIATCSAARAGSGSTGETKRPPCCTRGWETGRSPTRSPRRSTRRSAGLATNTGARRTSSRTRSTPATTGARTPAIPRMGISERGRCP